MVKKVFITGGLGFVGGRLSYFLQNKPEFNVIVSSRKKIDELPDNFNKTNIEVVDYFSFCDDEKISFLKNINIIIHLAALNEVDCVKYPQRAIEFNVWQTVDLIKKAQIADVKNFIYFSTVHVYASPLIGSYNEGSNCRAAHPYSITHKAAEDYVLAERDRGNINSIVIRLSNSFGSPAFDTSDRWTLLVNDICKQAVTENQITLHSNGKQKRDFITLYDVENAVYLLLNSKKEELFDGIINLASEKALKVIEMAEMVQNQYENLYSEKIIIQKSNKEDILNDDLKIDITRLKSIGFVPENDFEKEISDMLKFCKLKFS
jgi:UDP-glucose 4-epimerase